MTTAYKIHQSICFIINFLVVVLMIYTIYTDNNKAPVILSFFYPVLYELNLIILLVLLFSRSTHSRIYQQSLIALLVIFIPLYLISI